MKITASHLFAMALAIVQVIDILIHALTNQLEPIRIVSNILIWLCCGLIVSGRTGNLVQRASVGLVAGYVALNAYFLTSEGFTNPSTGDPRIALFILVALTVGLATIQLRRAPHL